MPTYKSDAIVLKKRNFAEADRILTLLTQKKGKITVLAKGVRRLKSRKGGNLDLLNCCELLLARGRDLDLIVEAQVKNSFLPLKKDLFKTSLSYFACEIVDALTGEGQENRQLFWLLKDFLKHLAKEPEKEKQKLLLLAFEFKVIDLSGFFSPKLIGQAEMMDLVLDLKDRGLEEVSSLQVDPTLLNRLELTATRILQDISEKEFKSLKFFSQVERQGLKRD